MLIWCQQTRDFQRQMQTGFNGRSKRRQIREKNPLKIPALCAHHWTVSSVRMTSDLATKLGKKYLSLVICDTRIPEPLRMRDSFQTGISSGQRSVCAEIELIMLRLQVPRCGWLRWAMINRQPIFVRTSNGVHNYDYAFIHVNYDMLDHRRNGSSSVVLTRDVPLLCDRSKFDPSRNSNPGTDFDKTWQNWLRCILTHSDGSKLQMHDGIFHFEMFTNFVTNFEIFQDPCSEIFHKTINFHY